MRRQVKPRDPGPECECRQCKRIVSTYIDITGGQWEIRCACCHHPIKRMETITSLPGEASDSGYETTRRWRRRGKA